jgi:hypothetical protein
MTPAELADKLDVTSFPSSIGPRKVMGKIRFKDYGFKITKTTPDSITIEDSEHWQFYIKVLSSTDTSSIICLEDKAINGGTYHSQTPLILLPSSDRLSLVAAKKKVVLKTCPEFKR